MHLLAAPTVPVAIEAPEIEHAIVGAVLRFFADPRVLDGYLVADVRAKHFWNTDYARIWQHAVALRARGIAPDPQLLHHNLGALLDGGPALLYGVVDGVPRPTPANIQEHARVLREIWGSRHACYLATAFQAALRENPAAIANGAMTSFAAQLQALRVDVLRAGADRSSLFHTARELAGDAAMTVDWVVEGYLARGAITELDATIKRGKTTLLRDQVRCITTGHVWLGFPTKQTRVRLADRRTADHVFPGPATGGPRRLDGGHRSVVLGRGRSPVAIDRGSRGGRSGGTGRWCVDHRHAGAIRRTPGRRGEQRGGGPERPGPGATGGRDRPRRRAHQARTKIRRGTWRERPGIERLRRRRRHHRGVSET
jgi:hypothetical protein